MIPLSAIIMLVGCAVAVAITPTCGAGAETRSNRAVPMFVAAACVLVSSVALGLMVSG